MTEVERQQTYAAPPVRLGAALTRPVDIAWLAAFRILFGLTMFVSIGRFIAYGWVDAFFVRPKFHFKYWGFEWLDLLPPPLMHALSWALLLLALCIAVGFCFRWSAALFTLGFSYLQLADVTNYLNHYYLASLLALLLTVSPAQRAWSLDSWRKPAVAATHVASSWLWLFRFQVGAVYTFAGLAKAHADWLIHAQPLQIWLAARTDTPLLGPLLSYEGAAALMSWAGFLFDSSIAWLLLVRKLRPYAYCALIAFHVLTKVLFPIGMFPAIMVLAALLFFSPEWPRKILRRLHIERESARTRASATVQMSKVAYALAALYCLLQLAVPLRFLAYGGDVRWHEQGMRFSWRVMVREKNGSAMFRVHSKRDGRSWYVLPDRYLTRAQEREMASQPDLILQFAHFLRDEYARRGAGAVAVYAEALVSLNGRPMAPMVDPRVDLAAVADGLGKATWIMPAPAEDPPSFRSRRSASSGARANTGHYRSQTL
jgi:hypothetical protein